MTRLPAFDYVQGGAIADFLLVHPDQAEIANAELPLNPHSAVGCQVCDLLFRASDAGRARQVS